MKERKCLSAKERTSPLILIQIKLFMNFVNYKAIHVSLLIHGCWLTLFKNNHNLKNLSQNQLKLST